jgi:hypothetical protein
MERAWITLQPLLERRPPALDTVKTAAEHFMLRGWTSKAHDLLRQAVVDFPDDPELQRLWDLASNPDPALVPEGPPAEPPNLDHDVVLAKGLLAHGRVVSARALLEKLQRTFPDSQEVDDLLWAMQSQDDGQPIDLDLALEDILGPAIQPLGRIVEDIDGHTDQAETEEFSAEVAQSLAFLSLSDDPFEDRPTEIDQRPSRPGSEKRFATEDTEIKRVAVREAPSPLHHNLPPRLEDEDDDLVVMSHRRSPASSPSWTIDEDPSLSQVGREVAHLLGRTTKDTPARPKPRPEPEPLDSLPELDLDAPVRPRKRRSALWPWVGALLLVVVLGGAFVLVLGIIVAFQR